VKGTVRKTDKMVRKIREAGKVRDEVQRKQGFRNLRLVQSMNV
jgi:hypothetical protein